MTDPKTKFGIIGERRNRISEAMLKQILANPSVELVWFVEADMPPQKSEKLYGAAFDYGKLFGLLRSLRRSVAGPKASGVDNRAFCEQNGIAYHVPQGQLINKGLPESLYTQPEPEFVLIAGCDQLLKGNGLKLARRKIINYHYSPLPAYRGKYSLFWQWYNREPFIGYTFHEVDEGIDTGGVRYQNKVEVKPEETYPDVWARVVGHSAAHLNEVVEHLKDGTAQQLEEDLQESYYPSAAYLELITASSDKTVEELMTVYRRLGSFRLANHLTMDTVVDSSTASKETGYRLGKDGIVIPLKDGWIKAAPAAGLPFSWMRILFGHRMMKDL